MAHRFKLVSEANSSVHLQPPVVQLGRGSLLGVTDKRCSRAQLELRLNAQTGEALMSHHGVNVSRLKHDGDIVDIVPEECIKLVSGDSFSLLGDEHWFRLVVEKPPQLPSNPGRPPCIYGAACTRKAEAHRHEYSHGNAPDVHYPPPPDLDDIVFTDDPSPASASAPSPRRKFPPLPVAADVEMSETTQAAKLDGDLADDVELILAFPSFSTATYKFDLDRAARTAAKVITDFLMAHMTDRFRLVLVTLDNVAEAAFKRHLHGVDRFAVVRADISQPKLFGAHVLANATNTTFSGGGSGVNKALHDADRELEQNTHRHHGSRAEVGKAYAVPTSAKSPLAAQGVTHVIHVLGPNMNPERPLCLNGNYDLGCTLLASAYTSLFNTFISLRSQIEIRLHAPPPPTASSYSDHKRPAAASPSRAPAPVASASGGHAGGGGWADVLMDYIKHPEKHKDDILHRDADTIVITDKFPKSKHHFLVMPIRPISHFRELTPADLPLLQLMKTQADTIIAQVKSKEPNAKFRVGFHAVPSMRHLHLHVISTDFSTQQLKNKKHWNSFTTEFFIPYDTFVSAISEDGSISFDKAKFEAILEREPVCPCCKLPQGNLPKTKSHYLTCSSPIPWNVQ